MKQQPLVGIVVCLIIGILLANVVDIPLWWLLGTAVLLLTAAWVFHRRSAVFIPSIALIWIASGMALTALHRPQPIPGIIGQDKTVIVTIASPAAATAKNYRCTAQIEQVDGKEACGKVMLYIPRTSTTMPRYGDRLLVKARIDKPSGSENPYQFDYRKYLLHKGIRYVAFAQEANLLGRNTGGLRYRALELRQRMIGIIQSLDLGAGQKGIAEALLLGWDNDLNSSTQQQYRDAGIAHLLCVSGLHVGIVAGLIGLLLFMIGRGAVGRIVKGSIQLIGVWAFVMVSGMAPASMRAAIMFSMFILGDMWLLQHNSFNTLAGVALILLCFNPDLIYDVGFQLSYSAVIAIIGLTKPFYRLLPWPDEALLEKKIDTWSYLRQRRVVLPLRAAQRIWQWLCLTTAAQIGTLPLVLYYFHRFPVYFMIANLTIVPCAGIILVTILLAVILHGSTWIAHLLGWELGIADRLTHWVSTLPHAVIDNIYCDPLMALILGIMAILLIVMLRHRNLSLKLLVTIAVGFLGLAVYYHSVENRHSKQVGWTIYKAGRHTAIELVEGHHSTLWASPEVADSTGIIDYQSANMLNHLQVSRYTIISTDTCHQIVFHNLKLYLVDTLNQWNVRCEDADYLMLSQNARVRIDRLLQEASFDSLLILPSNSHRRTDRWQHQCDSLKIPYRIIQ